MDGRFVPNITLGPVVVKAIARTARAPLDVHLMIVEPERYLEDFARAGADTIWVHAEACVHLHRTIQQIRGLGKRAGVSLNPHTPIGVLDVVLPDLDSVLIMTVNPGFGGQAFIPAVVGQDGGAGRRDRPAQAERRDRGRRRHQPPTPPPVVTAAGATVLIAGAAVFGTRDYQAAIADIRDGRRAGSSRNGRPAATPRRASDVRSHEQKNLSGRQDLNLRPFGPEPNALPGCATPRCSSVSIRGAKISTT